MGELKLISSELDILVYWMHERDRIRSLKENNTPKPWTNDMLLRDYRWCNVRRMDDRVSRWLLDNWYPKSSFNNQYLAAVLARTINWPDTLEEIISIFPALQDIRQKLHARNSFGLKVFTGAYVIPGVSGQNKVDSVLNLAMSIQDRIEEIYEISTMRNAWVWFSSFHGLGSFLAGQIVADLAFVNAGTNWPDRQSWAPAGPGSTRGLNRLMGKPKTQTISQNEFEKSLQELIDIIKPQISTIWEDRNLTAMDIQNCLCEFDKYRRLTLGEGKVRARYDGKGAVKSIDEFRHPYTVDMFSEQ